MKIILLSLGFVLLCFYFYNRDGFIGILFGNETKSYFVDSNSGWPYRVYEKVPGYKYYTKNDTVYRELSSNSEQNDVDEETVTKKTTNRYKTCLDCDGKKWVSNCSRCNMKGIVYCLYCQGYGNREGRICEACRGIGGATCYQCEGNPSRSKCSGCNGTGKTKNIFEECTTCDGGKSVFYERAICRTCNGKGGLRWDAPSDWMEYDETRWDETTGTLHPQKN